MITNKKEIIQLDLHLTRFQSEIIELKEKIILDFKKYMTQNYGFEFIAEYLDMTQVLPHNDIYIAKLNNLLYIIRIYRDVTEITINRKAFKRFDTIDLSKVSGSKNTGEYKIDEKGNVECVNRFPKTFHMGSFTYKYVHRDYIRQNKIDKIMLELDKDE